MKNFLIFEDSWARIAPHIRSVERFQPVLFRRDGSLQLNGEVVESAPIHAAWLNFEISLERAFRFLGVLLDSDELEFVQTSAAGLDSDFFKGLARKPIRLCNSDAQSPAIAEYVIAGILDRLHRFDRRRAKQRDHAWEPHVFRELGSCHCLLIGHGAIGSLLAERLAAFGCALSVIRRTPGELPLAQRVGTLRDLGEFLPAADIVILAAALNDDTRDLLSGQMFARFRPGAILVNIARGAMVDESALLEALNSGRLDYAILDVFRDEPLPDAHPFWDHERVLVTAHSSNAGSGRQARDDQLLMDNLDNYLTGKPLRNQVDLASIV